MRLYRIVLNFFSSVSRNVVGLGLGLIATPLILNYLGAEKYGAFRVLLDWVSQLGILEFGLFTALLPIFSQSVSKSASANPKTVALQAFKKYLLVIAYQSAGLLFIFLFLNTLIPLPPNLHQDLRIATIIFGFSILLTFSQVFRAYLDASQRGYILSTAMTVQNILFVGLALLLAFQGYGIAGQAVAYVASLGFSFLALGFFSWKEIKKYPFQKEAATEFSKSLKTQRVPHFIGQLSGRVSFLMDNMMISALLGAKAVTRFYLTQRLLQIAMQQLQQLGNSTWPAMSELHFQGETKAFRNRLLVVTQFIAFAAGALLSVLVFVNPPFVTLWTGSETFAGQTLSNLVLLNTGMIAIHSFWLWCFTGTGLLPVTIKMLSVQAVINIILSAALTLHFGVLGPALGTFITFSAITQPWMTLLLRQYFEIPPMELTRKWVIPFAVPTVLSVGVSISLGPLPLSSWWSLILVAGGLSATFLLLFPFLFIEKESRAQVTKKVRDILKKKFSSRS